MKKRFAISVIINLLAIAVPAVMIYFLYGGDQNVEKQGPGSVGQLLVIGGSAIFAFLCGLLSSSIMKKSSPTMLDVLRAAIVENRRAPVG